jgi:hypothetical protein
MTAFFHPSGTVSGGPSVASLSVADRALVSNAATISDAGASATNVYSSSKVSTLLDMVEAGVSYKEACIAATAAALPTCVYTIGPPGVLTGSASGALPVVGGVAVLAGDRVLVTLQAEPRQNGIYDVTQLGDGSTAWVLTRSVDSDGSPTSEMRGGNVVTVNEPVPSMRVLTGTGPFLMTDPVLANNDAILWTPYGSATIPTDLYTDTLTIGGGGVDGDVAVLRADDVSVISLLGSTGAISAASISTPGLTAMAASLALKAPLTAVSSTANLSIATLSTTGTASVGAGLEVVGLSSLKATAILTNPSGAGGQLFLRRTSDGGNAITMSEGGMTCRKVQYYNSALDTIGATVDGADGSGTFKKLTINGTCDATGHVTAASLGCSGAVAAGEMQPAGGIDRLGHRDVAGFAYYQLGREGGRDAILDMHNAAGAVAVRLDCAQDLAQKTGSASWVGVSDPRVKRSIASIDLAEASRRVCELDVVSYQLTPDYATASGQSPDYVWTGLLSTQYNDVYGVSGDEVQTSVVILAGVPTELVLLDTGQAVYDQIAAHKHAIGRLDAQAARLDALEARLTAAGL